MKIFIADDIAQEGVAFLRDHAKYLIDFSPGLSIDNACYHIGDCDAVIVRSSTQIKGQLLDAGRKLKVIGRAGTGTDNIDVSAATERGIVVLNTPDANATTTAELAIAHLLSLCRHLPFADRSVRKGKWERSKFNGTEIAGKTLGIIGFGSIGRIVASRAQGLKMKVQACDPFVAAEVFATAGVEMVALEQLLSTSDVITLHCPLIEKTRNLINTTTLAQMKPGTRLINCARGGLVDEQALYQALQSRHLGGAALDVYENEPPANSPLVDLDNIVFTPHLGASTTEAQAAVGIEIAKQVIAFLDHGEAINAVNLPRIPAPDAVRLKPWQELASKLGRLLAMMAGSPVTHLEIKLMGQVAEVKSDPITGSVLVGLLSEHLSVPVNHVNAGVLAKRQGITLSESRSLEVRDYLSLMTISARCAAEQITLSGTLFEDRYPRLVRINNYHFEVPLVGNLLFTRHSDKPGVVGAIGVLLAGENINITNMHVGAAEGSDMAIAVIGISKLLEPEALAKVHALPPISKVLQINL